MTGNNSCGARSIRYGRMSDNVLAIAAVDADGQRFRFDGTGAHGSQRHQALARSLLDLAERHRGEIDARFPKLQRRVGGYNLDELILPQPNLARLLVGSEGTLGISTAITLALTDVPRHRVLGICQFPDFRSAMATTQYLVELGPIAVELVDRNILALGDQNPVFAATLQAMTRGRPDCLLIVEFAGDALDPLLQRLKDLDRCMADHGFANAVVEITDPAHQKKVWEVREACLNIMMSMKGDAKPVSFIEDCAVPLEHLADYTAQIDDLFQRHGTRGTWYAHASVGCLHVRPILNMKTAEGAVAMRAIAEAACDLVKRYKGSYSGEHGDGLSRSEFIEPMFGQALTRAFEAVKDGFDPDNRLNPGKIVRPDRFDDRSLMRFAPGYHTRLPGPSALDWSAAGGFAAAVEMCNNNGTCRRLSGGVMCPSYRVTKDETHSTRGRANTLRLALSDQLGPDALTSAETKAALDLCVGCKACQRECPTGVDMARMKTEVLSHYHARHGLPWRERLVAYLPRYAAIAARLRTVLNLRNQVPMLARLSERWFGFAAARPLPVWRAAWRDPTSETPVAGDGKDIVLFADTFNRHFDPALLDQAVRVLTAAGYRLHRLPAAGRALCCGRTFLASGLVEEARSELRRTAGALTPLVAAGARIVGLEPSCLITLRDEIHSLLPPAQAAPIAGAALLLEELLVADGVRLPLKSLGSITAHLHGHCHQKAAGAMGAVEAALRQIPDLRVQPIESSCCGMAGAFGYAAEHQEVSKAMAELSLLPAVRAADAGDLVVADGTSCRHQIADGTGRDAIHVVTVLDRALA
jgi:Fe-S oxidoreductase/FAD/FMN-containing dehydrogenase